VDSESNRTLSEIAAKLYLSVTAESIEDSLSVAPSIELSLFSNRDKFDLVVMYDDNADTHGPQFKALAQAIYEMAFQKMLKRMPVLLIGGLQAWRQEFGEDGVVRGVSPDDSGRGRPRRHREPREHRLHAGNGNGSISHASPRQSASVEPSSPARHRSHTESATSSRMPSMPRSDPMRFIPEQSTATSRTNMRPLGNPMSPTPYSASRPADSVRNIPSSDDLSLMHVI
jgi:ubiquitin carboxyl-terminal hydrolase 8